MTEVKVGSSSVHLEAAPEFRGDIAALQGAARFKALVDWGAKLRVPEHMTVTSLQLQAVNMMVSRISSVQVCVVVTGQGGDVVRDSVTLCESPHTAVLVVVPVDDVKHVITVSGPLPAIACDTVDEVPFGPSGYSLEVPYADLLMSAGVSLITSSYIPMQCSDAYPALAPGAAGAEAHTYHSTTLAPVVCAEILPAFALLCFASFASHSLTSTPPCRTHTRRPRSTKTSSPWLPATTTCTSRLWTSWPVGRPAPGLLPRLRCTKHKRSLREVEGGEEAAVFATVHHPFSNATRYIYTRSVFCKERVFCLYVVARSSCPRPSSFSWCFVCL